MRARAAVAVALFAGLAADARAERPRLHWDTGDGLPVKLTILNVRGEPGPWLGPRQGRALGDGWAAGHRLFSPTGRGEVALPAGTYDVIASRGPEWTLARERVRLGPDGARLQPRLVRAFATDGWVAADLHVHADPSTDSGVPLAARAAQLAADGIDTFVSADHNVVTDYAAAAGAVAATRGQEITTARWGHLVAFPIPAELAGRPRGAVLARGRTGHDFIAAVRAVTPESIVIAVHPHSKSSSYLGDGRLDAAADRARPGFSYDFDAMEILNGYNRGNFGAAIGQNLRTWFHLLDRGHLVAAVGSSDTHWLVTHGGQGGWPRTFVQADAAGPEALVAGLRARRAQLSTGPFVRARCGGAGIGELGAAPGGRARLEVQVHAAPWVPVDSVTLLIDGRVHEVVPVARDDRAALRVELTRDLTLSRDAYVVVRVDGPRGGLAPVAGDARLPLPVLAITNPIFLDVGGDGRFDPSRPHGPHSGKVHRDPTGG